MGLMQKGFDAKKLQKSYRNMDVDTVAWSCVHHFPKHASLTLRLHAACCALSLLLLFLIDQLGFCTVPHHVQHYQAMERVLMVHYSGLKSPVGQFAFVPFLG